VLIEAIPRGWRAGGDIGVERIMQSFLAAGFQLVDPVTEGVSFRITLGRTAQGGDLCNSKKRG
jgi:hypothetical protein